MAAKPIAGGGAVAMGATRGSTSCGAMPTGESTPGNTQPASQTKFPENQAFAAQLNDGILPVRPDPAKFWRLADPRLLVLSAALH